MAGVRHSLTATVYDKRGRVLSVGVNSYVKTHPRMAAYSLQAGLPDKQYLHAEVAALIRCRGVPHKILIERFDSKGRPRLAKPCPVCELAILESGIKLVEYTIG